MTRRRVVPAASSLLLVLLTGCANPYSQFYTAGLGGRSIHEISAHEGHPQLYKPLSLGVRVRDLSDDLRRKIGSNRGVVVTVVFKGSPAFNADIMRGDIITRINYEVVADRQSFDGILGRYAGQGIVLQTFREGQERQVKLRLDSPAVGASGKER